MFNIMEKVNKIIKKNGCGDTMIYHKTNIDDEMVPPLPFISYCLESETNFAKCLD